MAFKHFEGKSAHEWFNTPMDPKGLARNTEFFALFPRDVPRPDGRIPSVLDAGCGFGRGGLYELLNADKELWRYRGFDVLPEVLEAFKMRHPEAQVWHDDLFDHAKLPYAEIVWCHGLIFEDPERLTKAVKRLWAATRHTLMFRYSTGKDSELRTIIWRRDLP